MARAGVLDLGRGRISDHIEGGRHEGLPCATQNRMKAPVDFSEESTGVIGDRHKFLDQPAHDGSDQGSAHAMAHNIADKDARRGIADRKNVEEIATHSSRGKVAMGETQGDGRGRGSLGISRYQLGGKTLDFLLRAMLKSASSWAFLERSSCVDRANCSVRPLRSMA